MAGVFRPYTWVDILGSMNSGIDQATQGTTTITGIGYIGEVDENVVLTDSVTGTLSTNQGWGAVSWGNFSWG